MESDQLIHEHGKGEDINLCSVHLKWRNEDSFRAYNEISTVIYMYVGTYENAVWMNHRFLCCCLTMLYTTNTIYLSSYILHVNHGYRDIINHRTHTL